MALENVLIRPDILNRKMVGGDDMLADIFFELFSRLFRDSMMGGSARQKIQQSLEQAFDELKAEVQSKFASASAAIQAWLAPFMEAIAGFKDHITGSGAAMMLQALIGIGELAMQAIANGDTGTLEAKLLALVDIAEKNLGLTVAKFKAIFAGIVDRVVDALTAAYLGGNNSSVATNDFMIGTYIRRIYDGLAAKLPSVDWDVKKLVHEAMVKISETGWDGILSQIQEFMDRIKEFLKKGSGMVGTVTGSGSVTLTVEPDPVSWYLSWFRGEVVGVQDRFNLSVEPAANDVRFDTFSAEFLEHWAHVSSIVMDTAESILHFRSIERGDVSANVVNGILQLTKSIITLAIHDKNDPGWVDAYKFIGNWWGEYVGPFGLSFFTAMEGTFFSGPRPGGCARFIFYATLLGKDVVEMLLYANWTKLLHDAFLSVFTLANADSTASPGTTNQDQAEGVAFLLSDIFVWLFTLPFGWVNYGFPLTDGVGIFLARWAVGLVSGWAGASIGFLIAAAIAGEWPKPEVYGHICWKSALASLLKFPIYDYLVWDGATDGGKRGRAKSAQTDLVTFEGYPDNADSPYYLPYKKDEAFQCAQGNLGFWSHNAITDNFYAVDFAMDHSMEVLASRGGTVDEFDDFIPNHSTVTANTVNVRHDDPSEATHPNPIHDKDQTGVVTTIGEYVHGAHYGVRYAFAIRGIPKQWIIGTPVKRGTFIMLSGDTGTSAYNHLHFQVGSANVSTLPFVYKEIGGGGVVKALSSYLSHNELHPDILRIGIWHPAYQESDISVVAQFKSTAGTEVQFDTLPRLFIPTDFYKDHFFREVGTNEFYLIQTYLYTEAAGAVPEFCTVTLDRALSSVPAVGADVEVLSAIRDSGDDYVILDPWASDETDEYKDRHIYIWWTDAQGRRQAEYKQITAYHSGDKKVTVDSNWLRNPPKGSQFQVGGPQYAEADSTERRLSYYAPYNGFTDGATWDAVNVQEIGTGRDPDIYFAHANYARHQMTGRIDSNIVAGGDTVKLIHAIGAPPEEHPSTENHFYNECFIVIETIATAEIEQYRLIKAYDGATLTVTVSEPWDQDFTSRSRHFRIGVRTVAVDLIAANVVSGTDTVQLAASASTVDDFYKDRYIALENRNLHPAQTIQVRKITGYVGATKVATVDSNWTQGMTAGVKKMYRIEPDILADGKPLELGKTGHWAPYAYPTVAADVEVYAAGNVQSFASPQAKFQYLTYKTWRV